MGIPREIQVSLSWGKLACKLWENSGNARPMVALHGWLDNANTFDRLIPLLKYPGPVYAIDLSGHGLSDHRPVGASYSFLEAVTDIHDAFRSLEFREITLLGHSLGGGISSLIAGFFPELVKNAIFIEALGPFTSEPRDFVANFRQFLNARDALSTKRKPTYLSVEQAVDARMTVGGIRRDSVEILCARGLIAVDGGLTWRTDSRLRLPTSARLTEEHVLAYLSEIACPTLLIRGKQGMAFPEPHFSNRKAAVKNLVEVVLEGKHHLHLDSPEPVAQSISTFLGQVK